MYKANGGENFILISNFLPDNKTPYRPINGTGGWRAEYFIDDVSVIQIKNPYLGKDTSICYGSTLTLKPNTDKADSILWQDGSRADDFVVTKPGKYWVEVWYEKYKLTDTIYIMPKYEVSVGEDQKLCIGETYTFQLPQDGATYEWPDGSTNNTFIVSQSSKYWVKAQKDGCTAYDTAEITFQQPLTTYYLPTDTFLCENRDLVIDLQYLDANVLWQDGSTAEKYSISKPGTYMLSLKNACGSLQHSINVTEKYCNCNVFIPNTFTPNADAVNDLFKPVTDCFFSSYNFTVYNRWGIQIFSTDNIENSWDGNYKGKSCTSGVYYFTLYAVADNGQTFKQRKYFTLLK
ncbi:MAG: gliding motility-associated C-terminal domain-containing protein [Sphingobacteriales bacterium]|nr:MAG: gliding motility-associated C-terminal domain-containing protein [Sphingobacteriales bacterium]